MEIDRMLKAKCTINELIRMRISVNAKNSEKKSEDSFWPVRVQA